MSGDERWNLKSNVKLRSTDLHFNHDTTNYSRQFIQALQNFVRGCWQKEYETLFCLDNTRIWGRSGFNLCVGRYVAIRDRKFDQQNKTVQCCLNLYYSCFMIKAKE